MGSITVVALAPWGAQVPVEYDGFILSYKGRPVGITHSKYECGGQWCPLHHPSEHVLNDRDMVLRLDRGGIIERLCEHGIGHTDPDSATFLHQDTVHGCDGCCG